MIASNASRSGWLWIIKELLSGFDNAGVELKESSFEMKWTRSQVSCRNCFTQILEGSLCIFVPLL